VHKWQQEQGTGGGAAARKEPAWERVAYAAATARAWLGARLLPKEEEEEEEEEPRAPASSPARRPAGRLAAAGADEGSAPGGGAVSDAPCKRPRLAAPSAVPPPAPALLPAEAQEGEEAERAAGELPANDGDDVQHVQYVLTALADAIRHPPPPPASVTPAALGGGAAASTHDDDANHPALGTVGARRVAPAALLCDPFFAAGTAVRAHLCDLAHTDVRAMQARNVVEAGRPSPREVCAKAMLTYDPAAWPVLVGHLPLPQGGEARRVRGRLCVTTSAGVEPLEYEAFLRPTGGELSAEHRALLERKFNASFTIKLAAHLASGRMRLHAYDLYDDAMHFLGGIVLSKLCGEMHGQPVPVVNIQSIVTVREDRGSGNVFFDVCRQLLFADVAGCAFGYLLAQCVKVKFWTHRLDETRVARALVYQLLLRYKEYQIYRQCTMRSQIFYCGCA